jgi:hypothetical protein
MNILNEISDEVRQQPIFQPIFGACWPNLPVVIHKHYANRPYSSDLVTVEGRLNVRCSRAFGFLRPIFHLLGGIPPYTGRNVPVTVNFRSTPDSREFHFDRTFYFAGKKPWRFQSKMLQVDGNEVIEIMRFGVVWRLHYAWRDGKVILRHKGYGLRIFGTLIPLPLTAILGQGYAEEIALDDDSFDMRVDISHPWWGKVYEYKGQFRITKEA